ncbi:hypothetical protein [Methylobacterium sp. WL120]|uniref:hypothetical protein n=1 Tax=Methylobacterium sp. WL120 TaxID=2603887 RepID=UPI0011CB5742|nr:hypothetical protein [Methylobacterium sp. WL120]TXM61579.1 hypothetical protein FV229_23155 [Methylobacterium sp. WL120]
MAIALTVATIPQYAIALEGFGGHTIVAKLKTLVRMCRLNTGECTDVETPSEISVYFGTKGMVYIYTSGSGGLEIPLGTWSSDKMGHIVRWSLTGGRAVWEASSESKYTNTIVFIRKNSSCVVKNYWSSSNPGIHLESRGVDVSYCNVKPGNQQGNNLK